MKAIVGNEKAADMLREWKVMINAKEIKEKETIKKELKKYFKKSEEKKD